jgi:hypothetical protein
MDLARVQIETVPRVGIERPSGRRFGALVHALATVDLQPSSDEIAAVAEASGRLLDATDEETQKRKYSPQLGSLLGNPG